MDEKCFAGIAVNEQQAYDMVMRSVGIVTLLDPILGHERCDAIGKQCIAENKTIQDVVLSQGLMTEDELKQVFSFENLISEVRSIEAPLQDIA